MFETGDPAQPGLGLKLTELLRVDRALNIIFKEPGRGYTWIRKPNAIFAVLAVMKTDLERVRAYLEAEVNG